MATMNETRQMGIRVTKLIREICHQLAFVILVLMLCYSNQDVSVYLQNKSLKDSFLGKINLVSVVIS